MKKYIAILLALVMVLALAACGQGNNGAQNPGNDNPGQNQQPSGGGDAPGGETVELLWWVTPHVHPGRRRSARHL